ncbi:Trk system potassium uptake protein TrkH [Roseimaritima multifibrata]|uniref:Trk system potassium uptake protein TrkH n=1 Tax=Roseimaritima multifibrata TaxID=1930274 RepID=A0A517MFP1_9BACT|nr:TrkH family potassium uptake protein [Roseimaritima multifibrata]QDS93666.1 Trk system potassium uptake protein TrkH [Roseimaritima multifibrata]
MNYALLCRLLGAVCLLIGGSMVFSLPWAIPGIAQRTYAPEATSVEWQAVFGFGISMAICAIIGLTLRRIGNSAKGHTLYRKEAMATVGLSWVMATVLGALPIFLSGTSISNDRPITFIESMFEAQSGFSTTGATVLTELEDPELVSYCVLFWRSWTHFLGGLGIVVLFVAILGQGSAGKAMMRAEMPGPSKEGSMPRMQHTALVFAAIYIGLNLILAVIYLMEGMTFFDALCHAFATMATGGFSTYNASLGRFNSALIEYTTIFFMILAGTNFTLLYFCSIGSPLRLWRDVEFRVFISIIVLVTVGVVLFGMEYQDDHFETLGSAVRYGLFQVVSVITTTGYGTGDFDAWNNFGRGALLLLMFVGGCAGSTGGGMKVIRHILFAKILRLEIERSHRPRVVRPLRLGGQAMEDPEVERGILLYFSFFLAICAASWMLLVTFEPDRTWGVVRTAEGAADVATDTDSPRDLEPPMITTPEQRLKSTLDEKLLDSASAVAATLNNIGPGLGVVGATKNYAGFSQPAKLLFVWLMMLGRVELFSVLVLLSPNFWRRH